MLILTTKPGEWLQIEVSPSNRATTFRMKIASIKDRGTSARIALEADPNITVLRDVVAKRSEGEVNEQNVVRSTTTIEEWTRIDSPA